MMTQETTPVKTWEGFNLVIFKVNLNQLWKNQSFTIGLRPLTSYCYPLVENLLTRPRASSETTDSFFLRFSSKYNHTRLCFFKLFSAATEWSSSSQWNMLHDNLKHVWRQPPLDITRDSHTQQNKATSKTWLGFPFYTYGQNIKPYTSYRLRTKLENSAEKHSARLSIDRV